MRIGEQRCDNKNRKVEVDEQEQESLSAGLKQEVVV